LDSKRQCEEDKIAAKLDELENIVNETGAGRRS
jgi:hypothetical protein